MLLSLIDALCISEMTLCDAPSNAQRFFFVSFLGDESGRLGVRATIRNLTLHAEQMLCMVNLNMKGYHQPMYLLANNGEYFMECIEGALIRNTS